MLVLWYIQATTDLASSIQATTDLASSIQATTDLASQATPSLPTPHTRIYLGAPYY
jgi:hypothetical protein